MKYVAFIGSRDLRQFDGNRLQLFTDAARAAVQHGYAVVTGACKGADQLAAETALAAGGKVLLVLPYIHYESAWIAAMESRYLGQVAAECYDPEVHPRWAKSVQLYHPAAAKLDVWSAALHARNFGIVGRSIAVVALPNYQRNGGGTAQGLRVAQALGIKLFDLRDEKSNVELMKRLMG